MLVNEMVCPFTYGNCNDVCMMYDGGRCLIRAAVEKIARPEMEPEPVQGALSFDEKKTVTDKERYTAVDRWAASKSADFFIDKFTEFVYMEYLSDVQSGKTPDVGAGQNLVTYRSKRAHGLKVVKLYPTSHIYKFVRADA